MQNFAINGSTLTLSLWFQLAFLGLSSLSGILKYSLGHIRDPVCGQAITAVLTLGVGSFGAAAKPAQYERCVHRIQPEGSCTASCVVNGGQALP